MPPIVITSEIFSKLVAKLYELDTARNDQMVSVVEAYEKNRRIALVLATGEANRLHWQMEGFTQALDILGITKLVTDDRYRLEPDTSVAETQ